MSIHDYRSTSAYNLCELAGWAVARSDGKIYAALRLSATPRISSRDRTRTSTSLRRNHDRQIREENRDISDKARVKGLVAEVGQNK